MVLLESMGLVDGFFWAIGQIFQKGFEHPLLFIGLVVLIIFALKINWGDGVEGGGTY